jgi:hypothetical protein
MKNIGMKRYDQQLRRILRKKLRRDLVAKGYSAEFARVQARKRIA